MPINSFENYPLTWRPDRKNLKRPVYLALAQQLEADITSGYLAAGTRLPPQRELADFLDLNFTTITRAYKLCQLKGLIHTVTGRGTFVSSHASHSAAIFSQQEDAVIDLAFEASFDRCNAMVTDTAGAATRKPYLDRLLRYDYPDGMPHQKMAGLNWLASLGVETDPDHMAVTSGAQNGLALALFSLFSPGDRIAVDLYTFANFIELAKLYRLHLVPIRSDEEGMLADELEAQCHLLPLQGIFLMPSCSNPTAVVMSEARKRDLARVIEKEDLILLEDDIHAFLTAGFLPGYEGPLSRLVPRRSVYLCSTSKSICSGLRVAYVVFGDILKARILKAIYTVNVKTSSLDVEIITDLILNGTAGRIVQEKARLARQVHNIFDGIFPGHTGEGHPLSFFRWLPIPGDLPGIQVEKDLLDQGLRVYHSDRFLCGQIQPQRYLRVALSTCSTPAQLQTGLLRLQSALFADSVTP